MKPILVLSIGILVCLAGTSIAQNNEDINLDALKSPSSPASQIIGNQPSSITRPKSWNEFEVSLFTNFILKDSLNEKNTAIAIGMRTMLWRGTKAEKEALDNRYAFLRDDLTATTRIGFLAVRTPCDNCTKE